MSRIAKAAVVALGTGAVVLGGAGMALADAEAEGQAVGSPGVISGNVIQVPINVPINLCGNTINVIGLLNPAAGNFCAIDSEFEKGHDKGHDKGHNKGHGYGH
ncbi:MULTISPECIES: chaplin [Streptomyces]|uniref:chaplin n=1 Tax=Streptomyces TaxID=1883 RepID=UPI0012507E4C|nr:MULTISPECIES: chaplin [Streptomyces]NYV77203.1 chaplin [Streptomyces sp. UH6]